METLTPKQQQTLEGTCLVRELHAPLVRGGPCLRHPLHRQSGERYCSTKQRPVAPLPRMGPICKAPVANMQQLHLQDRGPPGQALLAPQLDCMMQELQHGPLPWTTKLACSSPSSGSTWPNERKTSPL
jgi:hypothetical protein